MTRDHRPSLFPKPILGNARFWAGRRIAIFGGSFNPVHDGHHLIAKRALVEYGFDCIWWMLTPQNPLKHPQESDNFARRLRLLQKQVTHPRMIVTDIENQLGTRTSHQTMRALLAHFPNTDFAWIAGLDNAYIFDQWDQWRDLAQTVPFIFYNRPQMQGSVRSCRLKMMKSRAQIILDGATKDISSTALRRMAPSRHGL